jgi:putative ABC transport system permease protein
MFGELPYIFFISLAVYLAFEHWNFPDLTIEGSFIAGMAVTAYAFKEGYGFSMIVLLSLFVVIFYSFITFTLHWFEMPSLLSGLLTLFIAFWLNYTFNGKEIAVSVYDAINYRPFGDKINTSETYWWISLAMALIISIILIILDRTRTGATMRISRNTPSDLVPRSANMNSLLLLFICMVIFNFVACLGGMMKALSDNFSGIEMFGLISPGLACMFLVKILKHRYSTPKRRMGQGLTVVISHRKVIRLADSLLAVILFLFIVSTLLSMLRYYIVSSGLAVDTSLINAFTGIFIIILWIFFQVDKIFYKIKELL